MARREVADSDANYMFNELYGWKDTLLKAVADMKRATLEAVYPVGGYYTSKTDSRNPADILGFGTWAAVEGVVLAGYKPGDNYFGTPGAVVGEKTHALSVAEGPNHTHGFNVNGYTYTALGYISRTAASGTGVTACDFNANCNITTSSGSGTAHNNVQPTKVVYMWERTA